MDNRYKIFINYQVLQIKPNLYFTPYILLNSRWSKDLNIKKIKL